MSKKIELSSNFCDQVATFLIRMLSSIFNDTEAEYHQQTNDNVYCADTDRPTNTKVDYSDQTELAEVTDMVDEDGTCANDTETENKGSKVTGCSNDEHESNRVDSIDQDCVSNEKDNICSDQTKDKDSCKDEVDDVVMVEQSDNALGFHCVFKGEVGGKTSTVLQQLVSKVSINIFCSVVHLKFQEYQRVAFLALLAKS